MQSKQLQRPSMSTTLKCLLLCCQQTESTEEHTFILNYLLESDNTTLDRFISHAYSHGILPLVYLYIKNFSQHYPRTIPQHFLAKLKKSYRRIAQQNMLMTAELLRIMQLLEDNHIEALALKGPTLAQMAYGDITLRQYVDLDILVKEDKLYDAAFLLSQHHYVSSIPLSDCKSKTFLALGHDYALLHQKNNITVELHWRLMRQNHMLHMNTFHLWENVQPTDIHKTTIKTLDNETLLIYLCIHATKHLWERIEWIIDIQHLIKNNHIDWNKTLKICAETKTLTSLQLGLALATMFFHTKIPDNVLMTFNHKTILQATHIILDLLNSDMTGKQEGFYIQMKKYTLFRLLQNQSTSPLFVFLNILFDYSAYDYKSIIKLSKPLSFIYLLLRPIHLVRKNISRYKE